MIVRQDIIDELGLPDPDTWTWDDLLEAAKEIQGATGMYGIAFALGECGYRVLPDPPAPSGGRVHVRRAR